MTAARKQTTAFATVVALLVVAVAYLVARQPVGANHQPADKVVATASTVEPMTVSPVASSGPIEILRGKLRTTKVTDLILSVTSECAIWTDTTVTGAGDSSAVGRVELWIEIDGTTVVVDDDGDPATTSGTATDPDTGQAAAAGRVVYCNRAQTLGVTEDDTDDANDAIRLFQKTRSSNAFNWIAMNVGRSFPDTGEKGIYDIVVKAELKTNTNATTTGEAASATAAVGKRSLVVLPERMANDASI